MNLAPDHRRRELAQIHIARKQLALDEDTYRAMLWTVARVRSSADLDYAGRRAVIDHLVARGFKVAAPKPERPKDPAWAWVNNAAEDRQPMLRKIAVMLKECDREKAYADGVARQMFKVDLIEFCKPDQLRRIVAALVFDQRRREEKAP